jgi:hypothetical protein
MEVGAKESVWPFDGWRLKHFELLQEIINIIHVIY